ncbi:hypothetical protein BGZ58_001307 [Dissophora ornata]|nr:hypothetical protein BGZ58_001307 [Dissophora ornata]
MSTGLLINVLQQWTSADSVDNSWCQDLDAISKRLQVDADFRVELSQLDNIWSDISMILSRVVKCGLEPQQVEQLMFLFRVIRNAVAGVSKNQNQARIAGVPNLVQEVISQAAHTHYGNMTYIMMLRAGIQALSNLLTGNSVSKTEIWDSFVVQAPSPSCDQFLLSALLFSTLAGKKLLGQLLTESHSISGKDERKSFEMIYTFFNHLIDQGYVPELFEAIKSQHNPEGEDEYRIHYHGKDFYEQEGSESVPKIQELKADENVSEVNDDSRIENNSEKKKEIKQEDQPHLSIETVILLKMIDSRIYTHHQQQQKLHQDQQRDKASDLVSETEPPISEETVVYLTDLFEKVSGLAIEVFKTLDQPGVGLHGVEDLANLSSGLMLLLECFAHLSLYEDSHVRDTQSLSNEDEEIEGEIATEQSVGLCFPEWFKAQHMIMVRGGLVENAIELLRQADKSLARVTKPVNAEDTTATGPKETSASGQSMGANTESTLLSDTSTVQGQQAFFVGLKRNVVRLIGNLAYRSRHVQDRIRQCNGLVVMLSQCNIDDANPYLREYAILAMKNILTGNAENQALIEELQPIEAVDHPALQEARVKARLDAKTGRPILTQERPLK